MNATVHHKNPSEYLRMWRDASVGFIQINRPDKANAYNSAMLDSMENMLHQHEDNTEIRAIVFCGTGKRTFCAGADLDEMQEKDFESALNLRSAEVFGKISISPKVTLAAINGSAVGGGLELALACDIRISAKTGKFFFPEPRLGLIPAAGGTQRLPKIVGIARAKEMILGGCQWDANKAYNWGLVSEVVESNKLLERAQQWGEQISQADPIALQLAKRAIDHESSRGVGSNFELVAEALLYQIRRQNKDI